MDTELQQYLNGFVVMLSIALGAILTSLVLPTTGESLNTGSVLLWTAVFAALIGGSVYLAFLRTQATPSAVDVAK